MKNKLLYQALLNAYNVAEGQYSNIPDCCIKEFNGGRTWATVTSNLTDPKEIKRLNQSWDYVPCEKCFIENKSQPLKEGDSNIGDLLLFLMEKVLKQNEENIGNR